MSKKEKAEMKMLIRASVVYVVLFSISFGLVHVGCPRLEFGESFSRSLIISTMVMGLLFACSGPPTGLE